MGADRERFWDVVRTALTEAPPNCAPKGASVAAETIQMQANPVAADCAEAPIERPVLMTVREAAIIARMSPTTIRAMLNRGELDGHRQRPRRVSVVSFAKHFGTTETAVSDAIEALHAARSGTTDPSYTKSGGAPLHAIEHAEHSHDGLTPIQRAYRRALLKACRRRVHRS